MESYRNISKSMKSFAPDKISDASIRKRMVFYGSLVVFTETLKNQRNRHLGNK